MRRIRDYFLNIYRALATTLIGMSVTGKYAFKKPVTQFYPRERPKVAERYRGILHNKIQDCIGCLACARACPVDCIHIQTSRRSKENVGRASDGTPIKLWVTQFDIDMSLCMECGLCVEPCPTHCLTMTHEFEMSVTSRRGMYLEFATEADKRAAQRDARELAARKTKDQEPAAQAGDGSAEG